MALPKSTLRLYRGIFMRAKVYLCTCSYLHQTLQVGHGQILTFTPVCSCTIMISFCNEIEIQKVMFDQFKYKKKRELSHRYWCFFSVNYDARHWIAECFLWRCCLRWTMTVKLKLNWEGRIKGGIKFCNHVLFVFLLFWCESVELMNEHCVCIGSNRSFFITSGRL